MRVRMARGVRTLWQVALYFAASWCPMSTPVTKLLEQTFNFNAMNKNIISDTAFQIVYVSSDRTELQAQQYGSKTWWRIPYTDAIKDERTLLKRHFKTCAAVEVKPLRVHRLHEIPSLIIIDPRTHTTLTTNGVEDLKREGINALDYWTKIQHTVSGLTNK